MNTKRHMRDSVNQHLVDIADNRGVERFGLMNNQIWIEDPKRLVFTLSRYKFVAKMLEGAEQVIEVGCGDGMGARIVGQFVRNITVTDFDPVFIEDIKARSADEWPMDAFVHDIVANPLPGLYNAAFSMDVLEHIPAEHEDTFVRNISAALTDHAILIVGMPSLESQAYASPPSRAGHINCKTQADFKALMVKHFHNVLMFSMNDEVVHTGFSKMAHYSIAVCCSKR